MNEKNLNSLFNGEEEFEEDYSQIAVFKEKSEEYKLAVKNFDDISEQTILTDFNNVRANLQYLIESARVVLDKLTTEVAVNPSARNAEAFSSMLRVFTEMNSQIIESYNQLKKLQEQHTAGNTQNIQNQNINVFQGTLEDILKASRKLALEAEVVDE